MAERKITNCGDCAYVRKTNNRMWCPFHDAPVSNNRVCDDFLDEFDSPQWRSLMKHEKDNKSRLRDYTGRDIFAYLLTLGLSLVGFLVYYLLQL